MVETNSAHRISFHPRKTTTDVLCTSEVPDSSRQKDKRSTRMQKNADRARRLDVAHPARRDQAACASAYPPADPHQTPAIPAIPPNSTGSSHNREILLPFLLSNGARMLTFPSEVPDLSLFIANYRQSHSHTRNQYSRRKYLISPFSR